MYFQYFFLNSISCSVHITIYFVNVKCVSAINNIILNKQNRQCLPYNKTHVATYSYMYIQGKPIL